MERGDREHLVDLDVRRPVPAARPLSDFAVEVVGDELVILDGETLQYHTLNASAIQIWQACDGIASIDSLAASLQLPVEIVATTVGELGEASLLLTPSSAWSVSMSRRRAAKLIAAGATGAIGVPVVLSLTAPSHQAAASFDSCNPGVSCSSPSDTCSWTGSLPQFPAVPSVTCTLVCLGGILVPNLPTCRIN